METAGEQALPYFEAVRPDYSTPGNHDFDIGLDELRSIIADSPQRWLLANCFDGDEVFAADSGVRPTAVTTLAAAAGDAAGSSEIGLVGVTDQVTLEGHVHADALTVTDPVEAVEEALADGLASHDTVVVLSHAGGRDDEIAALDGVDLVLGGHDHDRRADTVEGTPVVHPGERGELVTEVEFDGGSPTVTLHDVTDFSVAEDMAAQYRELFSENGLAEHLTTVDAPVNRGRTNRYPESAIGNFITDAFRWQAGADVAICHPLMLRSGPPLSGDVTTGEVRATTPFDNEIHSTTLDGAELVALFECMADPDFLHVGVEVFGHVSGAHLSWERSAERLALVAVEVDGEQPDPSTNYSVVAPAFEFFSDLYPVLEGESIDESHGHQQDALVGYARDHGIDTETDGRMSVVVDTAPGEFNSLR
jgi:2',3'-cyclic-nucleotide 2'-phosphodiesterase (5'-nucleotidase family)